MLLQTEVQLYHCVPCGIAAGLLVHTEGESCILWAASLVGPLRGEVPAGLCSTSHHTHLSTPARACSRGVHGIGVLCCGVLSCVVLSRIDGRKKVRCAPGGVR